jgi:hypothetical protein
MDADGAAAFRAGPSGFFFLDEFPDAVFLYISQVFDHAHAVIGAVPLVQMLHSFAGELIAFKAKPGFAGFSSGTGFDPAAHAGRGLVAAVSITAGAMLFYPEVSQANTAVHSARSDQRSGYHGRGIIAGLKGYIK